VGLSGSYEKSHYKRRPGMWTERVPRFPDAEKEPPSTESDLPGPDCGSRPSRQAER